MDDETEPDVEIIVDEPDEITEPDVDVDVDVEAPPAPPADSEAVEGAIVDAAIDAARVEGETVARLDAALQRIDELEAKVEAFENAALVQAIVDVEQQAEIEEIEDEDEDEAGELDEDEDEDEGEPVPEDRSEPRSAGTHPLFRPWREWRGDK